MSVGKSVGLDGDIITFNPLDGKAAAVYLGEYAVYDNASSAMRSEHAKRVLSTPGRYQEPA
jgi:hypothetical protein